MSVEQRSPANDHARDYQRVAQAIRYLDEHRNDRPALGELAEHVGLSAHHFQRMFRRWCGLSPKQFLGYLTVEDAKPLLADGWPVLEVSDTLGLSGPARLHDAFVSVDAVTPGDFKRRGEGLELRYGFHPSPFGEVLLVHGERGICQLRFTDGEREQAMGDAMQGLEAARLITDPQAGAALAEQVFDEVPGRVLPVQLCGTNFQVKVWSALLATRSGDTLGYGELAGRIGSPGAARAVGSALRMNPIAWLIPCHRVIRRVGGVGGYRWGEDRKRIMLAYEQARRFGEVAA